MASRKKIPTATPLFGLTHPTSTLNAEQQKVVKADEGVFAVLSGPGSGKSRCLVERTARLLRSGVPIDDILSLTFTAEAAKNLRKRVEALVTIPASDRACGALTFHSLALSFAVRERLHFSYTLADNPLASEGQAAKIGYGIAARHKLNYKVLRSWISLQKRQRITPDRALAESTDLDKPRAQAYKEYDQSMQYLGLLDFDTLMVEMVNVLERNPEVRARWQYKYVMADEAQDIDSNQMMVLKYITEQHGNLILVGDCNQKIFSFRIGADDHFFEIDKWFPNVHKLYLGVNFRSSREIVKFVKSIAPVKNELLERFDTPNDAGVVPVITKYLNEQTEAEGVVGQIAQGVQKSTCVLSRTNFALRPIEEQLLASGIKYHYLGDSGFWGRPEVRNIMAFVQCAVGITDNSVLGTLRSPFACSRFLKKKELADAIKEDKKKVGHNTQPPSAFSILARRPERNVQEFCQFIRGLSALRNLSAKEGVKDLLRRTGALSYYREEENVDADNNPEANLVELVKVAEKYDSLAAFVGFYHRIIAASKNRKGVALGSIHSVKGLEYDTVFLIQAQEGMIPHKRATDLNEEACLLYVAASRAEKNLFISYVGQPSRFLPKEENE